MNVYVHAVVLDDSSDTRLGMQAQTVAMDFQKVFRVSDKIFLGLAGLGTDVQTVSQLYACCCCSKTRRFGSSCLSVL